MKNVISFRMASSMKPTPVREFRVDTLMSYETYWRNVCRFIQETLLLSCSEEDRPFILDAVVGLAIYEPLKQAMSGKSYNFQLQIDDHHVMGIKFTDEVRCVFIKDSMCLKIPIRGKLVPASTFIPNETMSMEQYYNSLAQFIKSYLHEHALSVDLNQVMTWVKTFIDNKKYVIVVNSNFDYLQIYRRTSTETLFTDMTFDDGLKWLRSLMGQSPEVHDKVVRTLLTSTGE